jgi:hypothetical protein
MTRSRDDLTKKFAEDFHLNVPDRKHLDDGKIAGSDLVRAIVAIVEESGKYPRNWKLNEPFDGGLIEKIDTQTYQVTWKAEVSVSQYKVMSVEKFTSPRDAAKLVAEQFFGFSYDGIPIDWSK